MSEKPERTRLPEGMSLADACQFVAASGVTRVYASSAQEVKWLQELGPVALLSLGAYEPNLFADHYGAKWYLDRTMPGYSVRFEFGEPPDAGRRT